jgi:hypothetical protein
MMDKVRKPSISQTKKLNIYVGVATAWNKSETVGNSTKYKTNI